MNRQTKRLMQRQKATSQDRMEAMRQRRAVTTGGPGAGTGRVGRRRPPIRRFLKEVSQELKKVNWPSRKELVGYTVVVLVAVVVLTSLVFGMDLTFSKVVLKVFGQS